MGSSLESLPNDMLLEVVKWVSIESNSPKGGLNFTTQCDNPKKAFNNHHPRYQISLPTRIPLALFPLIGHANIE